jgi:predicted enzyme related to lactoylglutathione lyase
MTPAVVHFEIQADDIERAKKFYETAFGWRIEQFGEMEYWGVYGGKAEYDGEKIGLNGGLLKRIGETPIDGAAVNAFVCTLEVENVDETVAAVKAAGGRVVVEKKHIPGVGWQAYCKDTEGNIFGLITSEVVSA